MSIERTCVVCGKPEPIRFNFADPEAEAAFHSKPYFCPEHDEETMLLDKLNRINNIKQQSKMNKKNFLNRGLKGGFGTGVLAFILAKASHLAITFALGFIIASSFGTGPEVMNVIHLIDNPLVGIIYLIIATKYVYGELKK